MTPEAWTVVGTGFTLAVLNIGLFAWLRGDLKDQGQRLARVENGQGELRERMAKLEGLLEGLREAVAGRRAA